MNLFKLLSERLVFSETAIDYLRNNGASDIDFADSFKIICNPELSNLNHVKGQLICSPGIAQKGYALRMYNAAMDFYLSDNPISINELSEKYSASAVDMLRRFRWRTLGILPRRENHSEDFVKYRTSFSENFKLELMRKNAIKSALFYDVLDRITRPQVDELEKTIEQYERQFL